MIHFYQFCKMAKIYAYTVDDFTSQQKLLIQKSVDIHRKEFPSIYEGKCIWIEDNMEGIDFQRNGMKRLLEIVNKDDIVFYTNKILLSKEKDDWKRLYKLFTERKVDVIEINNETGYINRQSLVYEPDFMKYTAEFMRSITNKEDPIPERYYCDVR